MKTWFLYTIRCCAAGLMVLVSLPLFIMAFTPEVRIIGLVGGTLFAIGGIASWPRHPNAWKKDPPTEKQLAYAEALGIVVPLNATKGEVSALISEVTGR